MSWRTEPRDHVSPAHVVVMGVSASGKSTLAAALARATGRSFIEADDLHPAGNVDLMRRGVPLTDAESQLATLEPLGADEPGVVLDLTETPDALVDHVAGLLAGLGSDHV